MMKVSVIGYFGYKSGKLDGQTVKTRMMYRLLSEHYDNVGQFDSETTHGKPWLILKMLWIVANSDVVVYLPAHNNLKWFFPLVWIVSKLSRCRIVYSVIGGWLDNFISNLPIHRYMLRHIEAILPETHILCESLLNKYGYENVSLMRNFRYIERNETHVRSVSNKLRMVFMARVDRQKGLEMIFQLGDYLNKKQLQNKVALTFYGQVNPHDKDFFFSSIAKYSFMNYGGVLSPDEINTVLSNFDIMLFPTHYPGECMPGSVIDGLMAGLPIVTTDWRYAREIIIDNKNGVIVPYENGSDEFNSVVESFILNNEKLIELQKNTALSTQQLSQHEAWKTLERFI